MSDNLVFPAVPIDAWRDRDVDDEVSASPERTIEDFFRERSFAFRATNDLAAEWKLLTENQNLLEVSNRLSLGDNLILGIENLTLTIVETFGKHQFLEPKGSLGSIFAKRLVEYQPLTGDVVIVRKALRPKVGQFSPSDELTNIWVNSAKGFALDASALPFDLPSQADIKTEFTKSLKGLFGTIGQQFRYEGVKDTRITRDGEFTSYFEVEICDRFLILPSRAARFLKLLKDELVSAIESGAVFQGAWGKIEMNAAGELQYALQPPNKYTQRGFVPAKRVE